jgi:Na+-transporting NADH:ubiquinone oxidoreductase subunit B
VTGAFLVALLPCVAFGLYNTGLQANLALVALPLERVPGWRGDLLERAGVGHDPGSVLACALHGALWLLPLLFVSLIAGSLWERVFARVRGRELQPGLVLFATLFTLALPPSLPLWQAALGISFGVVVGKEIFGGTGRYVVHPMLVGLAFLYLSYPGRMKGDGIWVPVEGYGAATGLSLASAGGLDAVTASGTTWMQTFLGRVPGALGETSTLACLMGAAFLVLTRAASWRILLGALLGMAATARLLAWTSSPVLPAAALPWHWHLALGSFAFATVFIATDPVSGPMTQSGRWIYGLLIGFLIVMIRVGSPVHPEGTTLAILLANVFAPLIDHGVVRAHAMKRTRRAAASGGAT